MCKNVACGLKKVEKGSKMYPKVTKGSKRKRNETKGSKREQFQQCGKRLQNLTVQLNVDVLQKVANRSKNIANCNRAIIIIGKNNRVAKGSNM